MRKNKGKVPAQLGAQVAAGARSGHAWRWLRIIMCELLHAVAFVPVLMVTIFLIIALPWVVPVSAECQRLLARWCGYPAPTARGEFTDAQGLRRRLPLATWIHLRMWHGPFWKQDLPLAISAALLSVLSLALTFTGTILVLTCAVAPFLSDPVRPTEIDVASWRVRSTSGWDLWWLEIVAAVMLALLLALLWGLGWMRVRLTAALSGQDEEELARRNAELTRQLGRVSAGRATLIDAFDAERARIERDLHDGAQQDLVAVTMSLGMARLHAAAVPPSEERERLLADLEAAQEHTEGALKALRDTVHGIRPVVLTERGLAAALRDLAGRAPLPVTVGITGEEYLAELSSPVSTTLYFAVSEALTNAAKHGGEGTQAEVTLGLSEGEAQVAVRDDGHGYTPSAALAGTGVAGMRERLESMGGRLSISSSPGDGTCVTMWVPMTPPWAGPPEEASAVVGAEGARRAEAPAACGESSQAPRRA